MLSESCLYHLSLLQNFLQPLRQEAIVNAEDESTLVGPVEELLKVNTDLCQKLSPPGEVISLLCVVDVFSEMVHTTVLSRCLSLDWK